MYNHHIYILDPFYFLLILLPLISTLFPYTTLFRSLTRGKPARLTDVAAGDRVLVSFVEGLPEARRIVLVSADDITKRDRKSTRLNSSHSQISYAVFCLKKKIK